VSLIAASVFSVSALVWAQAQQAPAAAAAQPSVDDMLRAFRAEMQTAKSDVMAKNLTLSAEQAAKFWPMFDAYQKLQNEIIDEQLKDIQQYIASYDKLDDAGALKLMNAHFARDTRANQLRQKYLAEFQKVLPTTLAVRAMQIDRRLSLLSQLEVSARIPLVH
jgi:Spy/CpxP family protein refolding chaperone